MIDDLALAELSAAAYDEPAAWSRGDVHAIRRDLDAKTTAIAFRGTADAADALRDARAWPAWDRNLGWCHSGFLSGARSVVGQIAADLAGRRVILCGHSLGGALALLTGALFVVEHRNPTAIVTFGAPRAGFKRYADTLRMTAVRQYRLGDDPVTEVPWLCGLYRHPRPLRQLAAPWAIDPLEDHHVARYVAAVKALRTPPAPPAQTLTRTAIERPSF